MSDTSIPPDTTERGFGRTERSTRGRRLAADTRRLLARAKASCDSEKRQHLLEGAALLNMDMRGPLPHATGGEASRLTTSSRSPTLG